MRKSFEEQFYVYDAHPLKRLWRNVRLIIYLAKIALGWLTAGGRIRRLTARKEAENGVLYVDEVLD